MKNKLRGTAALVTAVLIWGSAFIAQSVGMERIGPFTFQTFRNGLAILFLIPTVFLLDLGKCSLKQSFEKWKTPGLWKAGLLCGIALFSAASLQQVGLVYTDAGKAGFITAMYIVGVPLLGIFVKRKPTKNALFGVLLAAIGLYLLSAAGVSHINKGDLLLIGCALCYSFQILFVEFFGADQDAIRLNCIQVLITFLLSTVCMFATETFRMEDVYSAFGAIAYAGILSTGRDTAGELTWGYNPQSLGNMLFRATPLIMTGLSVAVAFKTGLFNIGAPGQYLMGTMATLMIALSIHGSYGVLPSSAVCWQVPSGARFPVF